MGNKITEVLAASHMLTNGMYLDNVLKSRTQKEFRCKTCGDWHTEQSDKQNICVSCREDWLKNNTK